MKIKNRKKVIAIIFLTVLLVAGCFVFFQKPQQAEAGWWDDTWLYRKSVAATNNTSAESNVYVSVTIANTDTLITAGKMQADCGDLRWTEYNGIVLPYYIVSGCNTASTVVHVELESFPAGAQTLYYYYGNPTAINGFNASDFSTLASNYTIVSTGSEEKGPGPAAYWSFDEGYGQTANDSTANGNDGTLGATSGVENSDPTWQDESMCVSGKCLKFDGGDDYVQVSLFDLSGDATYSLWFNTPDNTQINKRFLNLNCDTGYRNFSFDEGKIETYDGANHIKTGSLSLGDGNWHHIVMTMASNNLHIYVDGVNKSLTWEAGSSPNWVNQTATNKTLYFGSAVASLFFNGSIDEVRIYPYARSAAQIKKDYLAGLAGMGGGTEGLNAALGGGGSQKWMTDGLVGYWKMDESLWNGSANEVVDSSGAENHGVRVDNATTAAGKFGKGGTFDGTGDYVDTGSTLDITEAITISAWVKADSLRSGTGSASRNGLITDQVSHIIFTLQNQGKISFVWDNGVGDYSSTQTDAVEIIVGNWHHVVVTRSGTSVIIYTNGAARPSTGTNIKAGSMATFGIMNIGRANENNDRAFNGSIDQVRIYNRALSPKEVRDLYNFAPGPVLHLKMDENTGTGSDAVKDTSCNENHGTMETSMTEGDWVPGKFGTACDFDGTDDYVGVGDFAY